MSPLAKYVEKNLHSPSYAGKSDANKSPLSSPCSVSCYSVAPVMVTNATTIEEQLANNVDASHVMGKQVEAHDEVEASAKQHYTEKDKYTKELQISSDGLIPVDQLKEFIEGIIRSKIEGSSKSSLTYSKPYTEDRQLEEDFQQISTLVDKAKQAVLCYILQGILPRSIEELATRAHDMELRMIASGVEGPLVQELRRNKEKQEMKKWGKPFSKAPSKESMAVNITPFKLKSTIKDNVAPRNNVPYEMPQRKLTLKEMQAREYPFLDSDVLRIFDDLLEANLIDLPEMKRPEEAERKDDLKYCKYHRLVGHAIQDYFVFKDKVM
ncbi:UNVERIFIED_CONTAM: hypothetical protein Sangu_2915000 [Sesamum angustifolium]|uniref:Uncharacterized protein n=1 Tax=Sesamum angustifolium TaxID=2727405 RepID=A0AAW2ILI9_9LAMI